MKRRFRFFSGVAVATVASFLFLPSVSNALIEPLPPPPPPPSSSSSIATRRNVVAAIGGVLSSSCRVSAAVTGMANAAAAAADDYDSSPPPPPFVKKTNEFSYAIAPPPGFEATSKPLRTHLDEVNFVSGSVRGYQYGITVDPVRIQGLADFGTPEEVAARVVLAEVSRDGVAEVTLVRDPVAEQAGDGRLAYILEYLSRGTRGDKRSVAKIVIASNNSSSSSKLYVLTAQIKEENYSQKEQEILATVASFRAGI